jgi:MFS family permease
VVCEGLRYVAGSTFLWVTIALVALCTVGGTGSLVVALPKLVHDIYGQGVWLLGAVHAAGSIGSLVAILLTGHLNRWRRRGITMYLMMIGISMAFILLGLATWSRARSDLHGNEARQLWPGRLPDSLSHSDARNRAR